MYQGDFKFSANSQKYKFEFLPIDNGNSFFKDAVESQYVNGLAAWNVDKRILSDGVFGLHLQRGGYNIIWELYSKGIIDEAQVSFYINEMIFEKPTEAAWRWMESSESDNKDDDEEKVKRYPESHLGIGGWDTEVITNVKWIDNLE